MAQLKDLLVSGAARFLNGIDVVGDLTLAGNLLPATHKAYDFGSPSLHWNKGYIAQLGVGIAKDTDMDSFSPDVFYVGGTSKFDDNILATGSLSLDSTAHTDYKLYVNGTSYFSNKVHINCNKDVTTDSSTGSLIIGALTSEHLAFDGNEIQARSSNAVSSLYINSEGGATNFGGIVAPKTTNTQNLGTSTLRWKGLYLGTADKYGDTNQPVYWNNGLPVALTATVGSGTTLVYLNSGKFTASTDSAGDTATPVYLDQGVVSQLSATVGSTTKPVYLNGGTITASNATVGGAEKPVYMNGGTLTALSSTVGSATKPVYLNSGTITVGTYELKSTVNAGTANKLAYYSGAHAISSYTSTVGSSTVPVYMNAGVPTAISSYSGTSQYANLLQLNRVSSTNLSKYSTEVGSYTYGAATIKQYVWSQKWTSTALTYTDGSLDSNGQASDTPTTITDYGAMALWLSGSLDDGGYSNEMWLNMSIKGRIFAAKGFEGSGANLTNLNAAEISTGILPVARGGTGKATGVTAANYFLNALTIQSSTPQDSDYYISQSAGGGSATTTYHRRPMSALWTYIQGKLGGTSDFVKKTGDTMTGVLSITNTTAASSTTTGALKVSGGVGVAGNIYGAKVYGAVWNDYAEYRQTHKNQVYEPGRVVVETGKDTLQLATKRLEPAAAVVSDTYGFAIGETEQAKTPIAVTGRVLVYTYQDRKKYHAGDCVCAAPKGTVDIMTREEIREYPDRIIGIVSAVPSYKYWGSDNIEVNDRIWITVK